MTRTDEQERILADVRQKLAEKNNTVIGETQPEVEVPDWADVPGQALSNLGSSGAQFADDIWNMVTSPIETGKSLYNLAAGAAQKLIPDSWTDGPMGKEKYADALGRFFAERYGSEDEIKRTLATDPVGVLADFSAFLTGGATAAAKLPMIASQASRLTGAVPRLSQASQTVGNVARAVEPAVRQAADAVGNVGKWMDPLYTTARGAVAGAKKAVTIPEALLGAASGVGLGPVREAVMSGFEGGDRGLAFRENLRGTVDYQEVVGDALDGLRELRAVRNAEYNAGKFDLSQDQTIMDFSQIDAALIQAVDNNTFKGRPKNAKTANALEQLDKVISEWRLLEPSEFHTPEGMDALKQEIGSLIDWKDNSKAYNLAAQAMYDKVGGAIRKQAPQYDKIMKDYSEASKLIMEIEKAFSLNKKSTADAALRKLTSVMRNNVNTNYGARVSSAEELQAASGVPLMSKLAGQAMSSWTPRGLTGTAGGVGLPVVASYLSGNPLPLALLPAQSPRIVGEGVHATGRLAAGGTNTARMIEALLDELGMSSRGVAAGGYQALRPNFEERRQRNY